MKINSRASRMAFGAAVTAFLMAGAANAQPFCDGSAMIADLIRQISSCQTSVSSLQSRQSELQNDILSLTPEASQADAVIQQLAQCQADQSAAGAALDQANGHLAAARAETADLQGQIQNARNQISFWQHPLPKYSCWVRDAKYPGNIFTAVDKTKAGAFAAALHKAGVDMHNHGYSTGCDVIAQ